RSERRVEALKDRLDVGCRFTARMACQQGDLAANAVLHVIVASNDSGERRVELEELATGAQKRAIDPLAFALARDHVDDDLDAIGELLHRRHLDIGIGVGDGGGFVGGDDEAGTRLGGEETHRPLDAGAEIEHDTVVALRQQVQFRAQRHEPTRGKRRESARTRASGDDVEAAFITGGRLRKSRLAGDHAGEVALGRDAELHVDIGEAEIPVKEQDPLACLGHGMSERDREPGLADAAFPGCDGDDVAPLRRCGPDRRRERLHDGGWFHGDPLMAWTCCGCWAAFGRMRRASTTGLKAARPLAMSGEVPASAKLRRSDSAQAMTLPSRCTMSSLVTTMRLAPMSRKIRAISSVSTASPPAGRTRTGSAPLAMTSCDSSRRSPAL